MNDTEDVLCECFHKRSSHAMSNEPGQQHCDPCSDQGISNNYCKRFREHTVANLEVAKATFRTVEATRMVEELRKLAALPELQRGDALLSFLADCADEIERLQATIQRLESGRIPRICAFCQPRKTGVIHAPCPEHAGVA